MDGTRGSQARACWCLFCVCRFLQLELNEMEAFVNQHKSKVIKRQVIPFSLYCPIQVPTY